MIREIVENEIGWLGDLSLDDLPSQLPSTISLHARGRQIGLKADGVVGSIPLANGDTLRIRPKVGPVNFFRLLMVAEGSVPSLKREYDAFVEHELEDVDSIDSILVRRLFRSAETILTRSPIVARVIRLHRGTFAVGAINISATALGVASRADDPVVYASKDKTNSTVENRVLTEALLRAWRMMEPVDQSVYRPTLERWRRRFPRSQDLSADLEQVDRGFASDRYGGPRDYYREALMLARVLLGMEGVGFSGSRIVTGDPILISTADVYERYVRNVISAACANTGYTVTKGWVGSVSVYTDGAVEMVPDIVISKGGNAVLVADAKYKDPTAADHYQMFTYLSRGGVRRGILLSASDRLTRIEAREHITNSGLVVQEVALPMRDLATTERYLERIHQSVP